MNTHPRNEHRLPLDAATPEIPLLWKEPVA